MSSSMPLSIPEPPEELAWLRPVVARLADLSADELNEDVDTDPLVTVLLHRIEGMESVEADRVLDEDREAMTRWLAIQREHFNNGGDSEGGGDEQLLPYHFIQGFMLGQDADSLRREPISDEYDHDDEPPELRVDFPEHIQAGVDPDNAGYERDGVFVEIMPIVRVFYWYQMLRRRPLRRRRPNFTPEHARDRVKYGKVSGMKVVKLDDRSPSSTGFWKSVTYYLRVPGGAAEVSAHGDRNFDESEVESYLHTLRFERGTPA